MSNKQNDIINEMKQENFDLRRMIVNIVWRITPDPKGCDNCWMDLHEGCTKECHEDSKNCSEKRDYAINLITELAKDIRRQTIQEVLDEVDKIEDGTLPTMGVSYGIDLCKQIITNLMKK